LNVSSVDDLDTMLVTAWMERVAAAVVAETRTMDAGDVLCEMVTLWVCVCLPVWLGSSNVVVITSNL